MVLLIRSNSIASDSRVGKYISFLQKRGIEYRVLGWDRMDENLSVDNTTFFRKKSGYNVGGWRAVWYRILWSIFCVRFLFKNNFDVVHCCDLDAAFPAILYRKLSRKRYKVVFDVFDWYSDTLFNQNKIIRSAFVAMEKMTMNNADEVILCEEERKAQIPYRFKKEYLILPNIPYFNHQIGLEKKLKFKNDKVTLAYVGGFYSERFLQELAQLARTGEINLLVAGYGSPELTKEFSEIATLDNVQYFGKVSYEVGLNIMFNADLIYAMYCKSNPNHIYAAPNKYYEAMFLGKPILSTEKTLVGEKIVANKIGYIIKEEFNALLSLVKNINHADLLEKGKISKNLWDENYHNYTEKFMDEIYYNIVK